MPGNVLWVICGSGRGVGKTHLALALCRVLPDAVYAKQGSSRARAGKPAAFFRDDGALDAFLEQQSEAGRRHLVVESNALATRGRGDIIIFLEVRPGAGGSRGPRSDADDLRRRAHLIMGGLEHEVPVLRPVEHGPDLHPRVERAGRDVSTGWRRHLGKLGLEPSTESAVLNVLADQAAWNREWRSSPGGDS